VSDLRFLEELGAEFERIGQTQASAQRSQRGRRPWMRVPRSTAAGIGVGLSVLVVVAVVAVGFGVHSRSRPGSPAPSGGVSVVFRVTALNPRSPLGHRSSARSTSCVSAFAPFSPASRSREPETGSSSWSQIEKG
jgi:hypothetical protein